MIDKKEMLDKALVHYRIRGPQRPFEGGDVFVDKIERSRKSLAQSESPDSWAIDNSSILHPALSSYKQYLKRGLQEQAAVRGVSFGDLDTEEYECVCSMLFSLNQIIQTARDLT